MRRTHAIFVAVGTIATAAYFLVPSGIAQAVVYEGVGLSAVAAVLVGVRRHRPLRHVPWLLIAAGLLAFVIGDLIWDVYELGFGNAAPFPSAADAFYLAGYPPLLVGILMFVQTRTAGGTVNLIDALVATGALALPQWAFLVHLDAHGNASTLLERAILVAYPAMDILLLAGLARLLFSRGRRTPAFGFLVGGASLMLLADFVYGAAPSAYSTGSWLDAGWLLSYVLWGAAALHPSMSELSVGRDELEPRLTSRRLLLTTAALVAPPAVLTVEWATRARVEAVPLVVGGLAISLLVLTRVAMLGRRVERLHGAAEAARVQLEQQNLHLRDVDRLKDELVASVSHELRTPLTSIIGYVELLLTDENDVLGDDQRRFLEVVDRNSHRLLTIVNDLLFIARLQAGDLGLVLAEVDLGGIVGDCVEAARPRATGKGVELDLRAAALPTIAGARERLTQVVDNLVSNAVKFTPEGGHVTVSLRAEQQRAVLEVADDGIGIPTDEIGRLFERFFRASTALDREIQGTGLGLTIARAIVQAHGGEISVTSVEGEGTSFRVELPVWAESGTGAADDLPAPVAAGSAWG